MRWTLGTSVVAVSVALLLAPGMCRADATSSWRLASWQVEGEWRYALVPENPPQPRPTGSEEQYIAAAVKEVDGILKQLQEIPADAYVIVDPYGRTQVGTLLLEPPPEEALNEIEEACDRLGLFLSLVHSSDFEKAHQGFEGPW